MPQMAPLPWVTLLIITLIILFSINSILFFLSQPKKLSPSFKQKNIFIIKW